MKEIYLPRLAIVPLEFLSYRVAKTLLHAVKVLSLSFLMQFMVCIFEIYNLLFVVS